MRKKRLYGSITIEASLALTFFISGYLMILSFVYIVRAESAVQYGINKTAEEISRYCYAAERLSLDEYIEKSGVTIGEAAENIGFISGASADDEEASDEACMITELVDVVTGGRTVGGAIAAPVFRELFSRHVAGDKEKTDRYLKKLVGITSDDIDFSYSEILSDGKTIEIVAVYRIKLAAFGLFGDEGPELLMKNTAVTAAWVSGSYNKKDNERADSKWLLPAFERGKAWADEIREENRDCAVKGGKGITLYKSGRYSSVHSINIFSASYSECHTSKGDYIIKEKAVKKVFNEYASRLLKNIDEYSGKLQYENGIRIPEHGMKKSAELIIIVPAEAEIMKKSLEKIAGEILREKGVLVTLEYREKFFERK
jgi:hypothetical protein